MQGQDTSLAPKRLFYTLPVLTFYAEDSAKGLYQSFPCLSVCLDWSSVCPRRIVRLKFWGISIQRPCWGRSRICSHAHMQKRNFIRSSLTKRKLNQEGSNVSPATDPAAFFLTVFLGLYSAMRLRSSAVFAFKTASFCNTMNITPWCVPWCGVWDY